MPRLVRRTSLIDRIKARLDPYDFALWLLEELNDDAFDEWFKRLALPMGAGLNVVFVLARGASDGGAGRRRDNDVFSDTSRTASGWLAWMATFLVYALTVLCCLNAFATFFRKRHYRLFEQPVDAAPPTPSAHRVRIDRSPASSSPLQYLKSILSAPTAASRAHPDAEREVWELQVWNPRPINLALFVYFSPGHLLLYGALLPPMPHDPRPSVTVLMAMAFGALLSFQLSLLQIGFTQQAKDSALIHGQVMSEYDTKFVRPYLNGPVRDVATQTRESTLTPRGTRTREVDVYTPTTIVNRGFRTNPNPNYVDQYDPDHLTRPPTSVVTAQPHPWSRHQSTSTPHLQSPDVRFLPSTGASTYSRASEFSSPLKSHHEQRFAGVARRGGAGGGDGGSMGVYSHPASPFRKTAGANLLKKEGFEEGLGNGGLAGGGRRRAGGGGAHR